MRAMKTVYVCKWDYNLTFDEMAGYAHRTYGVEAAAVTYSELPGLFQKALNEFTPDRSMVENFLVALKRFSFRGEIIHPARKYEKFPAENIHEMTDAFIREAGKGSPIGRMQD